MEYRNISEVFKTSAAVLVCMICVAGHAADLQTGVSAFEAGDFPTAHEMLIPLAVPLEPMSVGEPDAQYVLGKMYHGGFGVPEDHSIAIEWYAMAASQWHPDAQYALAGMYRRGEGSMEAVERALDWLTAAATQGHREAQFDLASLYLEMQRSPENVSKGLAWLRTAGELNHINAQIMLASIYEDGELVPMDLNEAVRWYAFAVNQGSIESLKARNRILGRPDFVEDYPTMLRRLGLSRRDADALFCENFTWDAAIVGKADALTTNGRRLDRFTNSALSRITDFRHNLAGQLDYADYERNPTFIAEIRQIAEVAADERKQILERVFQDKHIEDKRAALVAREERGVFDLVFHNAFREHVAALSQQEKDGLWDYCVATYMPSGVFRSNIGIDRFHAARRDESRTQQIYYSSVDYGRGVVDWTATTYQQVAKIDVCDINLDLAGGIAIGVGTAGMLAAESTAAIGILSTTIIAGESVAMVAGSSTILVASAPAIATGVTVAAITGATVYLGTRGYCYLFSEDDSKAADTLNQDL